MSTRVWTVELTDRHGVVRRHGTIVAQISPETGNLGALQWRGVGPLAGMHRIAFSEMVYGDQIDQRILTDVKDMWRIKDKPALSVTYRSGRRVDFYR